jgi:hypothetical protein
MNQKIEQVKKHLRENKKVYIAVGISSVVTTATILLVLNRSESGVQVVQKITQLGFRNEVNPTVINLIELSTPSKPVHLVGTDQYFNSIHDAARKTGHHVSMISKNVNGKIPDLKGDVFELLESA